MIQLLTQGVLSLSGMLTVEYRNKKLPCREKFMEKFKKKQTNSYLRDISCEKRTFVTRQMLIIFL